MRFVAVGDVLVDVVGEAAPAPGERLHTPIRLRAGGSAANAAVWARALGAEATVVGRIGADVAGGLVEAGLRNRGAVPRLAQDAGLPTGVAVALGSDDAVVAASPGASAALGPEDIPDPLPGDALLVSGFSLLPEAAAGGAAHALSVFQGRWLAVDLASPRLASSAAGRLAESAHGANVLLATEAEARAVAGGEPERAARALATTFEAVVIKLGVQGALAVGPEGLVRSAVEPVKRRSAFGAGDAFAAGLLVSLGRGEDLSVALEAACAAGAQAAASPDGWPD
jgi:sugar/nucleoside kinase (ribokinase family)